MLPRLQAEETLGAATAAALGGGMMKRHDASRLLSDLRRRARPAGRARRPSRGDLAEIGIEVVNG